MKVLLLYSGWCATAAIIVAAVAFSTNDRALGQPDAGMVEVIACDTLQRQIIEALNQASIAFPDPYVEDDGTVTSKERYEGGTNSSDDWYEAFRGFSLHTALGGFDEIDKRYRPVFLYPMRMVSPNDEKLIDRSVRFTAMVRRPG